MPFIRVNGLEAQSVQTISGVLTPKLSDVIGCPGDWISFTNAGLLFSNGAQLTTDVFFHVEWFPRDEGVQDKVAQVITQTMQAFDPKLETITVVFVSLDTTKFYENGQHY